MKEVARYNYQDVDGKTLFSKIRFEPGKNGRSKDFVIEGLTDDTERVLYNLPAVVAASTVVFVEGEKDCETLRDLGYVATTMFAGSSGRFDQSYAGILKDKNIILIPDAHEPGRKYAEVVQKGLAGYAKS